MLRKLFYVFTREYRNETRYQMYMKSLAPDLKLRSGDIDVNVNNLIDENYNSYFTIKERWCE